MLQRVVRKPILSLVAVAAAIGALLVIAFFASPLVAKGSNGESEALPIGGVGYITVYNSQGHAIESWHGHNTLESQAVNDLSYCLAGITNPDETYSGCSGFTNGILISVGPTTAQSNIIEPATPTLQPVQAGGCSPACTGWNLVATFPSSDFQVPGCTDTGSCTVSLVAGGLMASNSLKAFDILNPSGIVLQPGDSLQITIVYTIT